MEGTPSHGHRDRTGRMPVQEARDEAPAVENSSPNKNKEQLDVFDWVCLVMLVLADQRRIDQQEETCFST